MSALAIAEKLVITEPGVYDIPEDAYHRDPVAGSSLSASGAKKLLECPARFHHDRQHPPQPTSAMEFGTAAHKLALGVGAAVVVVDAENWRSKAAQQEAAEVRACGQVPLLPADFARAQAVADAVRAHPVAGNLFGLDRGDPERSLFWTDPDTGVWLRARLDWLPRPMAGRPLVIADLKTCASATPHGIEKAVADYGYYIQAAWYTDAVRALGLGDSPWFALAFVETTPPHLVRVAQLDEDALATGRAMGRVAIERFRDCTESGIWPGYDEELLTISLPPWIRRRAEELEAITGDYFTGETEQ